MTSVVYFIRGQSGRVKIGFTTDLARRFVNLSQSSSEPLVLLAVLRGGRALEKELHQRFRSLRLHGEWFEGGDELLSYVCSVQVKTDVSNPAQEEADRTLRDKTSEALNEAAGLLFRLASDARGAPVREQISAAAEIAGLTYSRAFELWYGKARRIDSFELDELRRAARAHDAGLDADLIELRELASRASEIMDRIEARNEDAARRGGKS